MQVMFASLIFVIVVMGSSTLYVTGRSQIDIREHYRAAALLGSQKIEELKAANYYTIPVGTSNETVTIDGTNYIRQTVIIDQSIYKTVRVNVRWQQRDKFHNVNLRTYIAPR